MARVSALRKPTVVASPLEVDPVSRRIYVMGRMAVVAERLMVLNEIAAEHKRKVLEKLEDK